MQPNIFPSHRPSESWLIRYGIAVLLVAVATGIRIALRPIIPTGFPFLTYFLAVMLASWRGGLGPGLLASVLSTLAADLLLIEPLYEFHLAAGYYWVSLGVFAVETVAISILVERVKHAQETLRESEARLKSILNHAPAAIFIKDPAGRYLFMNEECARVLSVNREQAHSYTDHELFSSELAGQFVANDRRVWETEGLLTVEERVPQADGVHTSVVKKFLLRDEQGRPYALSGIALDITHGLKLEAAIQASEARLRLAQSVANIGVFDWDLLAQQGVWSPELEQIWGLPIGSYDGTAEAWRRLVHPEDLATALAGSQRSVKDPTAVSEFEYRIIRPDGTVRWIYAKAKTLCDADGRATRMVGVNLDITERKEAQLGLVRFTQELEALVEDRTRNLEQSQDRLRALTRELNLAEQRERKRLATELHDHLQQMLIVGKLMIGQGKQSTSGVPACEAVLKKVDEILSEALTYSRTLVAELCPPVLRDHGLTTSLAWLAEYMKTKYAQTVTVLVPDEPGLHLPEDQQVLLFQSVRELLINSSKHAGTGQATLTLDQREDQLRITVEDKGKGFDSTVGTAAAGPSPGEISSKFGLYSIQERMLALGGSLEVHSAPDQGTRASIVLPLAGRVADHGVTCGDSPLTARRSHTDRIPSDPATIRVMLVDDHAMIRQGLRTMLEAYQNIHITGEAANGEEAIALARTLQPDVVLMDINMPQLNGIEATAILQRDFPEIVVVGLSVNADRGHRDAMIRAGAATLLTKESPVEVLYHVIQSTMKSRPAGKSTMR